MDWNPRANDIFLQALEISDPANRRRRVAELCGADRQLAEQVERLLAASAVAGGFLETPPTELPRLVPATEKIEHRVLEGAGTKIGPYKLLEMIGEGGMGSVYLAEQEQPVRRRVALKIIKVGMDTRQVIARFEAERQALAMMDHPNIAKVLDAGTTETGRPYFVMELVNGIPLTHFCDEQHLTTRERLELFVPICQAVQHAHQKGIIHRDLKPSNILVALYDGRPVPKVIDFGVAKATNQRLTDKTMFTGLGQIIGTLEYMSPEQAQRNQLDVDTRSDIYSLGVVLYELLTGETPFDRERLRSAALDELLRMIREEEPPRPSTKLGSSPSLPSAAANRRVDPARLGAMLRGELDWIVMKTLEKDRARRYETANGLARDIERFLADEPVEACPPSLGYRLKKYVYKHRAGVVSAIAIAVLLILGTAISSWQAYRARLAEGKALASAAAEARARREEAQQRRVAEANERAAREQSARAEAERLVADAVREFLQEDLLRQVDAKTQAGSLAVLLGQSKIQENPTVRELLDRALVELDGEALELKFPGQPLVQAEILRTIGDAYRGIGDYERAAKVLERASRIASQAYADSSTASRETWSLREMAEQISLECDNSLGVVFLQSGRSAEAERLFTRLAQQSQRSLGPANMRTLISRLNLADALFAQEKFAHAAPIIEDALGLLKASVGPNDPVTLSTMMQLAKVDLIVGRTQEAMTLLQGGLEQLPAHVPADDPLRLDFMELLADAASNLKQYDQAINLLTSVLATRTAQQGQVHPSTLVTAANLAIARLDAGRIEEAIAELEQLQPQVEEQLGRLHPNHLLLLGRMVEGYQKLGRGDQAERLYKKFTIDEMLALDLNQRWVLTALNNLAAIEYSAGRREEALKLMEKVRDYKLEALGPEHSSTLVTLTNLATTYQSLGRLAEALQTLQPVAATFERKFGFDDAKTLKANLNLSIILWKLGRKDEGIELARKVVEASRRSIGETHLDTIEALAQLAEMQRERLDLASAAANLEQVCQVRMKLQGTNVPATWDAVRSLTRVYQAQSRWNEAIARWEELVEWQSLAQQRDVRLWLRDKFSWAQACKQAGRIANALIIARQLLGEQQALLGPDDAECLATLSELGYLHWRSRQFADAVTVYQQLIEQRQRLKGETDPDTIAASINLAVNQRDAGDLTAARSTVAAWVDRWRSQLKTGHPAGVWACNTAASIDEAAGQWPEAETLLRELADHWRRGGEARALDLASTLARLGANLVQQQKFAEAEREIAAALEIRAQRIPDDWITGSTRSMLGGVMLAQARALQAAGDEKAAAKLARAEPLLREGYAAMKSQLERIPPVGRPRVTEALERLVECYSVKHEEDQAGAWREELEAWKQRLANEASAAQRDGAAQQQASPKPASPHGCSP